MINYICICLLQTKREKYKFNIFTLVVIFCFILLSIFLCSYVSFYLFNLHSAIFIYSKFFKFEVARRINEDNSTEVALMYFSKVKNGICILRQEHHDQKATCKGICGGQC